MKTGDTFIISLTVRRPGRGESYPSRYEYGNESALVKAIDRMAAQIKTDLGLTRSQLAGDHDATEVEITTASFEAFRLYNEGRRLHLAGDIAESSRVMRKALELDPEFALAWRSLAMSLGRTEPETAACLEKALEFSRKASEKEQLWIKVDYFESRAEYGKALEACRQWASRFPNDGHALLLMGRQHLMMEVPESAHLVVEKCLRNGDTNPYTFYWAVCALRFSGKVDEADRLCERALSIHTDNMLMIKAGVENDLARGSFVRALRKAQRGLARGQNARLGTLVGDILLLKSDFAGAGDHYQALGPDTRLVQARLARLALAEGRYGRAADLAGRAKDHLLLAHIEARSGRLKSGSEEAGRALAEAEKSGHLLRQLEALQVKGLIETLQGDLPAATATLSRLRDLKSEGVLRAWERHLRFLEGLVGSLSGSSEQAGEGLEAAVGLLPGESEELGFDDHALYLYIAAREREKTGNDEAATGLYRRLLDLQEGRLRHPDFYALGHFGLGRIAEARNDAAGARQHYGRFLELWEDADSGLPEIADAKKRLAALDRQR
jgi:tetratricopeptide (TPR) repeat protein